MFTPGPSAVPKYPSTQKPCLCSLPLSWAGLGWFWEHFWAVWSVQQVPRTGCCASVKRVQLLELCWSILESPADAKPSFHFCQVWEAELAAYFSANTFSFCPLLSAKFKWVGPRCSVSRETETWLLLQLPVSLARNQFSQSSHLFCHWLFRPGDCF